MAQLLSSAEPWNWSQPRTLNPKQKHTCWCPHPTAEGDKPFIKTQRGEGEPEYFRRSNSWTLQWDAKTTCALFGRAKIGSGKPAPAVADLRVGINTADTP